MQAKSAAKTLEKTVSYIFLLHLPKNLSFISADMQTASELLKTSALEEKGVYRCKYGETGKLNHLNYSQWCRDIQFLLQAEQALPIVLGEEVRPERRNANTSDFDRRTGIAAAMIHASCEDSVKAYLHNMRDPHTM